MAAAREQRLQGGSSLVSKTLSVCPASSRRTGHEPAHPANADETVMLTCHDDLEMLVKVAATIRQARAAAPYV